MSKYEKVRRFVRERLTRRLAAIPGIEEPDIANLRTAGIKDSEELEMRFEKETLSELSSSTTVAPARLAELLNRESKLSGRRIRSSTRRHAFDFAAAIVAAALLVLLIPSLRKQVFRPQPPPKQPRVVAVRDIPMYRTIDSGDLKVEDEPDQKKWPAMLVPFTGKMATAGIGAGAALTASQVTRVPFGVEGKSVLRVPVKSVPALDGRPLPQRVEVLLSPRTNPGNGAVITAELLAVDSSSAPAVASLAVEPAALPELSRWIGSSDVYLMLRVP